jgi:hypothetical protein
MLNMDVQVYDISSPQKTLALASELGKFIKERQLTTKIQGREYVQVDGWQFALSQLGIIPMLNSLENQSTDNEFKYRADVSLVRLADDKIVGRGIAICSNKERTKKAFDEYAIASMAQTRAEGKAARMLLSWLMKAAGYETTPAEEMVDTEEADEIGSGSREYLHSLLENTTFDEDKKKVFSLRIDSLIHWDEYNKAKDYLMQNQIEDKDRIYMGKPYNQADISKAVRNSAGAKV